MTAARFSASASRRRTIMICSEDRMRDRGIARECDVVRDPPLARGGDGGRCGGALARWRAKARTSTSIPNTRTPSRSRCQSRLASMSASTAAKAPSPSMVGSSPSTASAASKVNGPANTESASNAAVASRVEQPDAPLDRVCARLAAARAGRAPRPRGGSSAESSRDRISRGDIVRVRAAASSMASGTPSSARTMPAMRAAVSSVMRNAGLIAVARSTNRSTALDSAASAGGASASGTASGPSSNVRSARTRSGERLVTSSCSRGSSVIRRTRSPVASSTCSMLSTTSSMSRPASAVTQLRLDAAPRRSRARPTARAIALSTRSGEVTSPASRTRPRGRSPRSSRRPRSPGGTCRCRRAPRS